MRVTYLLKGAVCIVGVMLLVAFSAFSQGSQGTIQGRILDSSGGTIAGAKVTVTDVARGTSRVLTTDVTGQYVAPSLTAGTYTIRAEATGFSTIERSNVLLQVGANVRVDLTLAPGEQTQTVTVTEEVPAIDPTSAVLGGVVSNESIVSLPLNGRNFARLLDLRPGVVSTVGGSSASASTNGRRLGSDVLLVEGITQFDMATSNNLINGNGKGVNGDAGSLIPIDAIQEFNTQQNGPAEYGWRDGSVVNVGVKSGTNSLHGTGWAFGRNAKATDAANYFTGTVTPATMEQFGGTAGGPILRNKLFWFASYEGLRVNIANITPVTIPSDVAGPGVTNSMVDACNSVGRANVNPLSALLAGLPAGSCVPQPASDTFENVFPYNTSTSNLFFPGNPDTQPLNNGLGKLDWNVNEKNHLNFFYFDSRTTQQSGGSLQPYWTTTGTSKTREMSGSWTWVPNSTWVNDVRVGWAGVVGDTEAGDANRLPSDPWPTGYSMNTGQTNPEFGGFPNITFDDFTHLGVGGRTGRRGPQGQLNIRDTVSYLRGNHAFKFGFEHVWVKFDDNSTQSTWGNIVFGSLTSFLEGKPTSGSIILGDTSEELRQRWYAAFVQDTWRITSRITLTPGLRYEYQGPPHSVTNDLGTFDPTVPGGIVQVGPGLPHSKLYSAEKANFFPRMGVAWDVRGDGKTVVRSGISLMGSFPAITALTQPTPFAASLPEAGIDRSNSGLTSFININTINEWSLAGPIFSAGSGSYPSCTTASRCSTAAMDPNFKRPKSLQWSVDIQRAITSGLTLDVAYVGNHGYDETHMIDLNAVPVGTGWTSAKLTSCFNQTISAATSSSKSIANAFKAACSPDSSAIVSARPYNSMFPYYDYINRTTSGFSSNYNGLQVTVDQRSFHGVRLLAAYTYSHALDMWTKSSAGTQVLVDPTNQRLQYSSSDTDIRHRFRLSPTWTIPGVKTPGQMLEGWSVSGVLALQGRFPWDARDVNKTDWVGTGESANAFTPNPNNGTLQYWNYSGPATAFNSTNIPIPCYGKLGSCTPFASAPSAAVSACETAAQAPYQGNSTYMKLALLSLYNNGCYIQNGGVLTPPAYGTIGNGGRNSFRGPQFHNVDMSISKEWHFGERYSAQFRTEFFNLFNTPTMGNPGNNPTRGITGGFGYAQASPDSNNAVLGSGGPRHIQFGLKVAF